MAQVSEFRYGVIGKLEYNRLKVESVDNKVSTQFEPGAKPAGGLYMAKTLGKTFFLDASLVFSRAFYTVNFTRNNATFMDANVRFTEVNMNLNLILNPNAENVNIFIFGGGQLLLRRWGEERFNNAVLPKTYWPSSRFLAQGGLGCKFKSGKSSYFQPFVGFRYALEQQLVYDVPANQYYLGLVFCFGAKGQPKNKYKRCPTEF